MHKANTRTRLALHSSGISELSSSNPPSQLESIHVFLGLLCAVQYPTIACWRARNDVNVCRVRAHDDAQVYPAPRRVCCCCCPDYSGGRFTEEGDLRGELFSQEERSEGNGTRSTRAAPTAVAAAGCASTKRFFKSLGSSMTPAKPGTGGRASSDTWTCRVRSSTRDGLE